MFTDINALDWLELKSVVVQNPLVVSPDTTVLDAIRLMARYAIAQINSGRSARKIEYQVSKEHLVAQSSCVVVVENDLVVGILTASDTALLRTQQQPLDRLLVRQVMTQPAIVLHEEAFTDLFSAINLLLEYDIGHLPILDEQDRLVGIVTHQSLLPALNPLELYKQAHILQEKVLSLEAENLILRESHTAELERGVEARTAALQTQAEREKLVAQIAQRIRNFLNLQEILDVCVAEVRVFLECDRVLVYQFQPDWSGIIIAESITSCWSSTLGNQVQDGYVGQRVATLYNCEQPIVVNNIYTAGYSHCHIQLLEHYQIKANLVVPIRVAGQLWGLLIGNQCGEYRNWQQNDITLLQNISVQLAIAIQQATTHQQLQQELNERRLAEQRYASLAEAALVGISRTDAAGNCIYVNNRYFEITGLTRETAFGKEWQKALHPEDRDRVITECYQSVQENRPFQLEYRFLRPDGTVTWVYGQSLPERDPNGLIIGHVGNITDITDQKRSVEALQRSEAHYRALISAIPDLIIRINRAGIYLEFFASPNFRMLVNNPADWVGSHVYETLPPDLGQKRMKFIELALQTNTIQSYQQDLDFDGTIQMEEVRIVPYSEDEVLLLVQDITARKQAEIALEASQRSLSTLISNLPGYVYRVQNDPNYTAEFISSGVEDITGYHPDEYVIERSISCGQEIHPDDANVVWEIIQKAVATRQAYECEYRIITKTGAQKWVWERGQGIYSQNNELLFLEGFVTDISDRKRTETALKKAENQYREAQRLAHLGNWEYDIATDTCYWSDEVFRIFEIERQTVAPNYQAFLNLIHPDDREMVNEAYTRHLHDGTPYKVVHRCLMPEGQIKYVQDECETIYAADGTPILSQGTMQDVTTQKLAQLELERLNAKLETIVAERTQKLWQVNNLQRAILNSTDYAIISTDLTGTIQTFNAGAERMLGYSAQEVVGKLNPLIFHDPEELSQQAAVLSVELGQNLSPDLEVVVAKARQGIVSETEWTHIRKDGSRFPLLLSITALKNAHQQIIGFLGIAKDISEQKQSEMERQQLLQELSAFKLALDQSAIVSIVNTQGAIEYVNDRFCEIFGYSREQLIGQKHTIVYSDYHFPSFIQELWDTITSSEIWRGEICYQGKNGSLYWFASTIVPFLDEQGQPFQYLGIDFDITDRKLVKAKLNQENSFRQQIMENMAEGLCVCHDIAEFPFVRFTVWNPQMLAITGYSLEEINSLGWYQILYPDSEVQAQAIARRERMQQQDHLIAEEWEIQRLDGYKRTIAISTSSLLSNDGQTHTLALIQDITDRKAAEKQLQDREARYHGLMEAASDAIILTDEQGNLIEVNRKAEELLGYTKAELTSMHFTKLHRLEELPRIVTAFEELTEQKSRQVFDVNFRCKDGHLLPTNVSASLIEIQGEMIIQYIFRDITERKRIEAALKESETRFRRVFESNIVGMIFTDFSGVITEANDRFLEIVGYTREELRANQLNWATMTPPEYNHFDLEQIEQLLRDRVLTPVEKAYYHKDGHRVPVLIGAALLDSGENGNCVCVVLDISDRKQAEQKIHALAERETLLREITQRIRRSLDLHTIFNTAVQEIRRFLSADRVGIFQFYPDSGFDDGEFVSESVSAGFMSVLEIRIHDHCFGERFAHLYQQGRFQATDDVDNADLEDCHRAVLSQFQIRANLILPLLKKDQLWGLLCIHQCSSPRQWQPTEISFTQEIANQLTLAIHQASLYEQIQSELTIRKQAETALALQLQQQKSLGALVQQIRQSFNLEEILALVTQQVKDLMNSDRAIVFRLFPDGKSQIVAESADSEFVALKDRHWNNESWSQDILDSYWQGTPRIVPDVMNDTWTHCLVEYSIEGQIQSKIVAPILQEIHRSENHRWVAPGESNKLWGILAVHACGEKRVWLKSEAQILQQIANQLAIAIQQANLFEQLQLELTERQQAQQQLVETNQQLAISNQELARATRLKDEFLANMSHELRTPLNSILGMTEGLQDQIFGSINEQQIRALKTIESSGSHLLELINDILDVAKIESGQLQLDCTPTSIASLCQSSLTFIKQLALKKHIQLEIKIPHHLPDLLLDERRIRQVLINLLNNAVKFTPEGGYITLEVSCHKEQAGSEPGNKETNRQGESQELPLSSSPPQSYLRIAISDTGIGIAKENINKLFQPFLQIDSALNRQYAGTGLGLALVKRLVELHSGQVSVTSELGVGSCFTIDLPYIASDFAALESVVQTQLYIEPQELEQGASPLILLVEDNEANLSTISNYLRAKGYLIVVARNGQEAIACVKSENPDLILMDIQMPGMDGLEAIQQIRSNPNYVDVPIIALTALAMTEDRDRCLAAGANDYLTKPVKLKQLVMSIQQQLVSQSR